MLIRIWRSSPKNGFSGFFLRFAKSVPSERFFLGFLGYLTTGNISKHSVRTAATLQIEWVAAFCSVAVASSIFKMIGLDPMAGNGRFRYLWGMLIFDLEKCSPGERLLEEESHNRICLDQDADRKIENEVNGTFNFRKLLGSRVTVRVLNGIATLSGSVSDEQERLLAIETANSMGNVKDVRDELFIGQSNRAGFDSRIVLKIYSHLMSKANVSIETLSIDERKGVISLRGTVDNPVRKSLIETLILEVYGVRSVRNKMKVDPLEIAKKRGDSVDDASIVGLVRSALNAAGLRANIESIRGSVVLSGIATNPVERTAIGSIAQSFRGVKWVTKDMSVS